MDATSQLYSSNPSGAKYSPPWADLSIIGEDEGIAIVDDYLF